MKNICNTKMPADENMPFGGYALSRQLDGGRVLSYSLKRNYGTSDWQWAQDIKKARAVMAEYEEDGTAPK